MGAIVSYVWLSGVSICSLFQSALLLMSSTRLSLRSFDPILSALMSFLFSSSQFWLCNFLDDISQSPRFSFPFLEFAPLMLYPNHIRRYAGTGSCSAVELVIWGEITWAPFYPERWTETVRDGGVVRAVYLNVVCLDSPGP